MPAKLVSFQRSEYDECIALVEYLDILMRQQKVVSYTHVPNETYTTSRTQKRKNMMMGVAKGFPDYVIILRDKLVFIEMKREKNSTTSPEQKFWIEELNKQGGVFAEVCRGFNEAKDFIDEMVRG